MKTSKIIPFLWFEDNAFEAANFYVNTFKNSEIHTITRYNEANVAVSGKEKDSVMTVGFTIEGHEFTAINGGPVFQITPVISFFVLCDTIEKIDSLWEKISNEGNVMMELDKYPFSEKYGWVQDKFGVSWQLMLHKSSQNIKPCLMFSGNQHKKAEEAINFYLSVFPNSKLLLLERYKAGQGPVGAVVHSLFKLNGQEFTAMDSHEYMPYDFNPAISFVVNCKNQEEIDYYWDKLSEGGDENAQQCGWLKDKFGLSWQIVPDFIGKIMNYPDSEKSEKALKALFQMKKIDINKLQRAME